MVALLLCVAWVANAATPISFEGPKITTKDQKHSSPIFYPGNFAVYNFAGTDKVDAAVPTVANVKKDEGTLVGDILGAENLNQWDQAGPDVFYNTNHGVDVFRMIPFQVVNGKFTSGDANSLAILNFSPYGGQDGVTVCGSYTGDTCTAPSLVPGASLHLSVMGADGKPIPLRLWAEAAGDFNGDGKDDLAVIGYTEWPFKGYLVVLKNVGGAAVFDGSLLFGPQEILSGGTPGGIPLSVTTGDFDGDGKLDIAVGAMPNFPNGPTAGAFVNIFNNNGSGSFSAGTTVTNFKINECNHPTGLISYNPNSGSGDNKSDLVLTCYDKIVQGNNCTQSDGAKAPGDAQMACIAWIGPESGPVVILKNGGATFSREQTIEEVKPGESLDYPFSTTTADYNGDGKADLAVASHRGMKVATFAGDADFHVTDGNSISTSPYPPKFIQTADKNADGLPDVVLVATKKNRFPEANPPSETSVDVIGWAKNVRLDYNLAKADYTNKRLYSAADLASMKDRIDVSAADLKVIKEGGNYKYSKNLSPEAVEQVTMIYGDYTPTDTSAAPVPGRLKTSDAVIVLINIRPTITWKEPDCSTKTVTVYCTPSAGHTITECKFSSPDIPDGVANWQTAPTTPPGGLIGTFNLPQDQKTYTFTVTAKQSGGGQDATSTFTVNRANCSSGGTCPVSAQETQVYWDDPWTLCADSNLVSQNAGKTVKWLKTGGDDIFTDKGIMAELASVDGNCITGRFKPGMQQLVAQLSYQVGEAPACPAKAIRLPGTLEGQSTRACSMGGDMHGMSYVASMWLSLLVLPVGFFIASRRKVKAKSTR